MFFLFIVLKIDYVECPQEIKDSVFRAIFTDKILFDDRESLNAYLQQIDKKSCVPTMFTRDGECIPGTSTNIIWSNDIIKIPIGCNYNEPSQYNGFSIIDLALETDNAEEEDTDEKEEAENEEKDKEEENKEESGDEENQIDENKEEILENEYKEEEAERTEDEENDGEDDSWLHRSLHFIGLA